MSSTKKSKSVLKSAHTNVALSGKLHKTKGTKIKETFPRVEQIDGSEVEADADEDSGDDDGGIDEEGMERLMKALGDDGLDEFEQAQLEVALDGADSESEEEDGEEDRSEEEEDSDENEEEAEGDFDSDTEDEQEGDGQFIELEDIEAVIDDAVPIQKVEINNEVALARIRESIQLDPSLPWTETLAVSYPHTIDVDVNDDLNREMALESSSYKQALHSANHARQLVTKSFPNFPWTRPSDYFAEMVKSDVHMERIRQRVLDEKAGIKKSEEKRKEREGKKFGKQVQIEKLKDRERGKKEMEERLKGLKRKRKDVLDNPDGDDDAFDIAVEDALSDRPAKRGRGGPRGGSKLSRQGRDTKYGFGGAGRRSKQNNAESTDDFSSGSRKGFGGGGRGGGRGGRGGRGGSRGGSAGRGGSRGGGAGRGGSKRLGKSKRITARSK
ncbi:eukaryotic rRNA processing protein EBP2-domain-containing protein [Lentinula detonsa]|uniref:Eukaryotic rRNA processing protein EBP2-domain-containing protein n=1 Tax=Lentinula detonsa TaxID=2804962 RepID=A0A9W8P5R9_9AGAR|nr:eukaryotic rRNA processing protein EBP2-domain-containing protein [Lentinula detonsa]